MPEVAALAVAQPSSSGARLCYDLTPGRMMRLSRCGLIFATLGVMTLASCSKKEAGGEAATASGTPAGSGKRAGNSGEKRTAEKLETAVPYGKHVACADLFPLAEFAARSKLDIGEIKD